MLFVISINIGIVVYYFFLYVYVGKIRLFGYIGIMQRMFMYLLFKISYCKLIYLNVINREEIFLKNFCFLWFIFMIYNFV